MIETPIKHKPTGRVAAVVRVTDFWSAAPVSIQSGKYVLVVATEGASSSSESTARNWVDAGAAYVCAWGSQAPEIEETFDYSSFLPELGTPLPFTLMTTNHKSEALSEALWFAFYNATAPDSLVVSLKAVVVVVDSINLEEQCVKWIQENRE